MVEYYPPWGFYFKVEFDISSIMSIAGIKNDVRFQSVSGLSVEYETEDYKEGGENRFVHKLPVRTKYSELVLKRGMVIDSNIIRWCLDALENAVFKPCNILVMLMNEKDEIILSWNIVNAWPAKWNISDLNSSENSVVIETLTLNYQYFRLIKGF
jgi:phage tail-like protein